MDSRAQRAFKAARVGRPEGRRVPSKLAGRAQYGDNTPAKCAALNGFDTATAYLNHQPGCDDCGPSDMHVGPLASSRLMAMRCDRGRYKVAWPIPQAWPRRKAQSLGLAGAAWDFLGRTPRSDAGLSLDATGASTACACERGCDEAQLVRGVCSH